MITMHIEKKSDYGTQLFEIKKFIDSINTNKVVKNELLTLSSEIITNIQKYASKGEFKISLDHSGKKVFLHASDHGNGVSNISLSFKDHFSTSGSLGIGLPTIVRLSDDFSMQSSQEGVVLHCVKEL